MKRLFLLILLTAASLPPAAKSATYYSTATSNKNGLSIRLADPAGSIYQAGEAVRFSVQSASDAFILVFDVDTDGGVHLLYPRDARSLPKLAAGATLTIPQSSGESLLVGGSTGMEFVFAVGVPSRDAISDREVGFMLDNERLPADRRYRIDGDPLLAANRIAAQLVRGIQYSPNVSLAYTYFFVNESVDFPRYLCSDCARTGKDPYASGMPEYAATDALDALDGLAYPLPAAFSEVDYSNVANRYNDSNDSYDTGANTTDQVSRVYVTHYPVWDYGWYYSPTTLWYCDPFFYDPWACSFAYYPYYPRRYYRSSFYFGIGFNWWNTCGSYFYPYYYDSYFYRGHRWHGYDRDYIVRRTLRRQGGVRYKTPLYNAMDVARRSETPVRYRSSTSRARASRATVAQYAYRSKTRPIGVLKRQGDFRSGTYKRGYSEHRSIYSPRSNPIRATGHAYTTRRTARTPNLNHFGYRDIPKRTFDRRITTHEIRSRSSSAHTYHMRSTSSRSRASSGKGRK